MRTVLLVMMALLPQLVWAQITYETVRVDYDSAWEFRSLKLIPVREKGPGSPVPSVVSLSRAMREGLVTVSERGTASVENVHWLRIKNNSNYPVYIASGQTFTGGRQDRMVTRDTVLTPTGKDQYVHVMCVEENRWSKKERQLVYSNYANMRLRRVLDKSRNQSLVWQEIYAQLDSSRIKSPTLAYAALNHIKESAPAEREYLDFFLDKFRTADSTIVGFVCVTGKRITGTDIFAGTNMFYDELQALLPGYISEAVLRGSVPTLPKEDVEKYMNNILSNEKIQQEYCEKHGKLFKVNDRVVHITAY